MTPLHYDSRDGRYHGAQSDGTPVCIDGDAYAEALQRRERDGDSHEVAERDTSDPDGWNEDMEGWIPVQSPALTTPEAVRAYGLNRHYQARLARLAHAGTIRATRVGRDWLLDRASLEAWLASPRKAGRRWPVKNCG